MVLYNWLITHYTGVGLYTASVVCWIPTTTPVSLYASISLDFCRVLHQVYPGNKVLNNQIHVTSNLLPQEVEKCNSRARKIHRQSSDVLSLPNLRTQPTPGGALLRQLIGSEWRQLSAGVCALDCDVPIYVLRWQQPNSLKIWTIICLREFCGTRTTFCTLCSLTGDAVWNTNLDLQSWSRTGTQSQLLHWEQLFN